MKYYESPKISLHAEESLWEDQNDKTRMDLVRGLPYDILPMVDPDGNFAQAHFNTLASQGLLTNGVKVQKITYCDPAVHRTSGGGNRTIIFDLTHTSAVDGYSVSFIYEKATACMPATFTELWASEDGINWERLDKSHPIPPKEVENDIVFHKINLPQKHRARFIKVIYKVALHVYIESIEVYGCRSVESALPIDGKPMSDTRILGYPKYEDLCGVHNMALLYHCTPGNEPIEANLMTKGPVKSILGYYDKDGNLKDTFFDSFLMLPRCNFEFSEYAFTKEGRSHYYDNLFADGYNLDAVEQAAAELSEELGKEVRVKIFLTISRPRRKITDFGDVDGTGSLNLSKKEDCVKAIQWMVNTQYNRFQEKQYQHLDLCGFYWFEEEISAVDLDETYMVQGARDAVHAYGKKLIWIPWFCAGGFDEWKEAGIDLACMQPNYVFNKNATRDVLYKNGEITKKLGMTVELELHWEHTPKLLTMYLEYLEVGAELGYMKTPKIYYEMGGIAHAREATDPNYRSIYDATYLFAKEQLTQEKAKEFIQKIQW